MPRRKSVCLACVVAAVCLVLFYRRRDPQLHDAKIPAIKVERLGFDTTAGNIDIRPALKIPTEPHVAFVLCGKRLSEAVTLLKSLAIFHTGPLTLHAFVERPIQQQFSHEFSSLINDASSSGSAQADGWEMHLYDTELPQDVPQEIKNLFEPCSSLRLFLSALLPQSLTAVVYLDVDTIILSSLTLLWAELHNFKKSQVLASTRETEEPHTGWYPTFARHPYYGSTGLNTGVLLMRLDAIRAVNLADELMKIYTRYKDSIHFGDQDLINIYANSTPESIYLLPCSFNFRWDHCRDHLACPSAVSDGPRLVHGNRGFFHGSDENTETQQRTGSPKNGGKGDPAFTVLWKHFNRFDLAKGHLRLDLYNQLEASFRHVSKRSSCAKVWPLFLRPLQRLMRQDAAEASR